MGQELSRNYPNISFRDEDIEEMLRETPLKDLPNGIIQLEHNPETRAIPENVHRGYFNPQHEASFSPPLLDLRLGYEVENLNPVSRRLLSAGIPIPRRVSAYLNPLAVTPREIWMMVGEEIDGEKKKTLLNLTRTCRLFHAIFTPILFRDINLNRFDLIVSDQFLGFFELAYLRHVRSLTVASGVIYDRTNVNRRAELHNITLFNERIMECLLRMPGLVSFSFGELGRERLLEPYTGADFCTAPLYARTLDILRENNPRLRHLAVKMPYIPPASFWAQSPEIMYFWNGYRREAAEHLGTFKNLKSLVVEYFTSDMRATAPSLLATLLASPGLTALSIDGPSNMRSQQLATGQDFLHGICIEYEERNGKPLALRRFHVGESLLTPDGVQILGHRERWIDLEKLVEFSGINNLHIQSQSQDMANSLPPPGWHQQPLYNIITDKTRFNSLVCLSVERFDLEIAKLIHNVGHDLSLPMWFLSRLHFYWFDYNDKKLRNQLRFNALKQTFWPKTVSFTRPLKIRNVTTCRKQFVDTIVKWSALETLRIPLDLCRLADGELAKSIAVRMPNLRHLAIHQTIWAAPPSRHSQRVHVCELFILGFAWSLCRDSNLTYVRVHDHAYRVTRAEQASKTPYSIDEIDLRTLAAYESELFTLYRE